MRRILHAGHYGFPDWLAADCKLRHHLGYLLLRKHHPAALGMRHAVRRADALSYLLGIRRQQVFPYDLHPSVLGYGMD